MFVFLFLVLGGWASLVRAAQWTVGIYMCADNGMNDQAYEDLAEMKQIGSSNEVNIIVQVDNAARDSHPGCRRYRIRKNGLELLADLGEVDMADTATLIGFGRFLAQKFPADKYFLVLWDHGSGWHEGTGRTDWIFQDETPVFRTMGVAGGELAAAVASIKRILGKRIAILGFDACLMGMMEVATEVLGGCDYMLGSEGLVPWGGWPYDKILELLVASPVSTPEEVLPAVCAAYVEAYPGEDVCLSALNMRQLTRVLSACRRVLQDSLDISRSELRTARQQVQTFPLEPGHRPVPADDHIDFGHFWQLGAELPGVRSLRMALAPLVVAESSQAGFDRAQGAAVWFPDNYLAFKAAARAYARLAFADSVPWLEFLNAYFALDDVKPTQPAFTHSRLSRKRDLQLWWSSAWDLAPVTYTLYEFDRAEEMFSDYCEDMNNWSAGGWTTSSRYVRSAANSFFSGSASNLDNRLVLLAPLELSQGGLLSFFALFQTEEAFDSAGRIRRDVCVCEWSGDRIHWSVLDSFYGSSLSWQERRYVLPACSSLYLRFRYVTNGSINGLGVFLEDIKVYRFGESRMVAGGVRDTFFRLFNLKQGTHNFVVTARDSFGNVSLASYARQVEVADYAEPYTRPAPFSGACQLVLDFPADETVDVTIHTVSGTPVRRFDRVTERLLAWDGRNQAGRELADGMYLVVVEGKSFRQVGRIAKVAR